ncbi:hypothetical protein EJB05_51728, partial [Eragrostis curvula]
MAPETSKPPTPGAFQSPSISTTRAAHETGQHLHKIDCYSKLDEMAIPRWRVKSAPFRAGGHEWQLLYYPNGDDAPRKGRICVDLVITHDRWWNRLFSGFPLGVTVAYKISILVGDGNQEFSCSHGPICFIRRYLRAGALDVVAAEELRSAMASTKSDSIVLRINDEHLSMCAKHVAPKHRRHLDCAC